MLVVETIAKIRRAHFVQGKSIKAICRELGVSRKVVRKVVRSGATEFSYERKVQPKPKIGPIKDALDALLATNEARPARERLTAVRIFEEVRAMGFEGGYDAIRRYVDDWREERASVTAAAFVPLSFAPGEAFQFDWSHGADVSINDEPAAKARDVDSQGVQLGSWQGCVTLDDGQVFLLGDTPGSYDGRYFGVTGTREVVGRANLILGF